MYRVTASFILGLLQVLKLSASERVVCTVARKKCHQDVFMCAIALYNVSSLCELKMRPLARRTMNATSHVFATAKPCSEDCFRAIHKLKGTKLGSELHRCDCEQDGHCLMSKSRISRCLHAKAIKPKQSCTLALASCMADTKCSTLKRTFLQDCTNLINGLRCDKECLAAQERLYESEHGKPLMDCECDGTYEAYCHAIKAHAQQLKCRPGLDGSGKPYFIYYNDTDLTKIHGEDRLTTLGNSAFFLPCLSWSLLFVCTISLFVLN